MLIPINFYITSMVYEFLTNSTNAINNHLLVALATIQKPIVLQQKQSTHKESKTKPHN